jgi:hypothetical protein
MTIAFARNWTSVTRQLIRDVTRQPRRDAALTCAPVAHDSPPLRLYSNSRLHIISGDSSCAFIGQRRRGPAGD